jgi:hypothetical protein
MRCSDGEERGWHDVQPRAQEPVAGRHFDSDKAASNEAKIKIMPRVKK